ncbi:MAG: hypothetical protein LUG99_04910 [Lachnospiraceae bacterium]|nr:hypothetical protein [Lachnospiraceae bacterium]
MRQGKPRPKINPCHGLKNMVSFIQTDLIQNDFNKNDFNKNDLNEIYSNKASDEREAPII